MHNEALQTEAEENQVMVSSKVGAFHSMSDHQRNLSDAWSTKVYFQRFLKFEQCCAFFNCVALLHSAILYDLVHKQSEVKIKIILEWTIFCNTGLLIILTLFRYKSLFTLHQFRGTLPKTMDFATSGYLEYYFAESLLLIIIPNYWCNGIKIPFYNEVQQKESFYYVNEILCLLMLLRIILIIRCVFVQTFWFCNRAQRVCQFYAIEADYKFVIKSMMRTHPYEVISTVMVSMIIYFGYAIRICESPLNRNDITSNFFNYENSFWYIIVTMSTLGYGDFFARTYLGRLVMILVCIFGIFVVSILVVALTNSLILDSYEIKSMTVLERLILRNKMIQEAGSIVTIIAKMGIFTKRGTLTFDDQQRYLQKLRSMTHQFKITRRSYKSLQDTGSEVETMNNGFYLLRHQFMQIEEKQLEIISNSQGILEYLNNHQHSAAL